MLAVVWGEQTSAKNRWSSSHTRVDPRGERFGEPSGQTVAWNASFCSTISRFMSPVRIPIYRLPQVSAPAHGTVSSVTVLPPGATEDAFTAVCQDKAALRPGVERPVAAPRALAAGEHDGWGYVLMSLLPGVALDTVWDR